VLPDVLVNNSERGSLGGGADKELDRTTLDTGLNVVVGSGGTEGEETAITRGGEDIHLKSMVG